MGTEGAGSGISVTNASIETKRTEFSQQHDLGQVWRSRDKGSRWVRKIVCCVWKFVNILFSLKKCAKAMCLFFPKQDRPESCHSQTQNVIVASCCRTQVHSLVHKMWLVFNHELTTFLDQLYTSESQRDPNLSSRNKQGERILDESVKFSPYCLTGISFFYLFFALSFCTRVWNQKIRVTPALNKVSCTDQPGFQTRSGGRGVARGCGLHAALTDHWHLWYMSWVGSPGVGFCWGWTYPPTPAPSGACSQVRAFEFDLDKRVFRSAARVARRRINLWSSHERRAVDQFKSCVDERRVVQMHLSNPSSGFELWSTKTSHWKAPPQDLSVKFSRIFLKHFHRSNLFCPHLNCTETKRFPWCCTSCYFLDLPSQSTLFGDKPFPRSPFSSSMYWDKAILWHCTKTRPPPGLCSSPHCVFTMPLALSSQVRWRDSFMCETPSFEGQRCRFLTSQKTLTTACLKANERNKVFVPVAFAPGNLWSGSRYQIRTLV